ncbi:hypothetical protein EK904_011464, partial [Melospiza melodia maxima]
MSVIKRVSCRSEDLNELCKKKKKKKLGSLCNKKIKINGKHRRPFLLVGEEGTSQGGGHFHSALPVESQEGGR